MLKLTLPNSSAHEQVQKQQVTVEVNAEHQYVVNKTPIPFTDLENALKIELAKIATSPTVVLKFDNSLTIQDLADVMQIGYKLGAKMVLATKGTNK